MARFVGQGRNDSSYVGCAKLILEHRQQLAISVAMIRGHAHLSARRYGHEVGPLCAILGRLQVPPVIALDALGFVIREQLCKNFVTQQLEVQRYGLRRDRGRREGTDCVVK